MRAVIGQRFPNRPKREPVSSVPTHTKATNAASFLKLLSISHFHFVSERTFYY